VFFSAPTATAEAAKPPADGPKPPSEFASSSQTQLQMMFSRSRLNTRLWLNCRLELTRTLLATAALRLTSSDGQFTVSHSVSSK